MTATLKLTRSVWKTISLKNIKESVHGAPYHHPCTKRALFEAFDLDTRYDIIITRYDTGYDH